MFDLDELRRELEGKTYQERFKLIQRMLVPGWGPPEKLIHDQDTKNDICLLVLSLYPDPEKAPPISISILLMQHCTGDVAEKVDTLLRSSIKVMNEKDLLEIVHLEAKEILEEPLEEP